MAPKTISKISKKIVEKSKSVGKKLTQKESELIRNKNAKLDGKNKKDENLEFTESVSDLNSEQDSENRETKIAKKSRWKLLPIKNIYEEYHPCLHRWIRNHSLQAEPQLKRYILRPVPEIIDILAEPLCRRLLTLWLNHSEILQEDRRAKLLNHLLECGFTEEQLNQMLEEEKRKKEIARILAEAGPFDVYDENGNLILPVGKKKQTKTGNASKNKGGKKKGGKKAAGKKKGGGKKKGDGKKKGAKKGDGGGKGKKKKSGKSDKGKKGKTKSAKGKTGKDDEFGYKRGKPGQLKPGWPHSVGLQLMLQIWSFADQIPDESYISLAPAYFDVQARQLLQVLTKVLGFNLEPLTSHVTRMVLGCLNFSVWLAQNVTSPAQKIANEQIPRLLSMRGEILENKLKGGQMESGENKDEAYKSYLRKWTQHELSFAPPARHSEIARKLNDEAEEVEEDISENADSAEDNQFNFLRVSKWYYPLEPEFMYGGPRIAPKQINFLEINDEQLWLLGSINEMDPQPLIPQPVPGFYYQLRPLQHPGGELVNFRQDCWYIMSQTKFHKPCHWGAAPTIEIIEMVFAVVQTMVTTPNLSMKRLLELIAEICTAIELAEQDEQPEPEYTPLDEKRTIILERLFVSFFSTNFRDFDDNTAAQMRVLCKRGAVLLRYLYQHTASELWNLQCLHTAPISSEVDCDPAALVEWEDWLRYLIETSRVAMAWQQWLSNASSQLELPEDRGQLIEEAKRWLSISDQQISLATVYANKADNLQFIEKRPLPARDRDSISMSSEEDTSSWLINE